MGVVARGRVGEVDAPVGRDIEIIGVAQAGVIDDRGLGAAGLGRELA